MRPAVIAAAAIVIGAAWYMRDQGDQVDGDQVDQAGDGASLSDLVEGAVTATQRALGMWRAPAQYAALIAQAEARYGLPPRMLERLLWQECRWRADIIDGRTRSSVGAIGIAQFMPATAAEMGIDPLNVSAAINAAGAYLARLFGRFGTWSQALAAYNWGQGNVQRKGLGLAPYETRTYYTSILADVNTANGTAYV